METKRVVEEHDRVAGASSVQTTQAARMRAAIEQAVALGPGFLRGDVDADHMANAMVRAVHNYTEQERATGGDGVSRGAEGTALAELMACGSGYLAGRCDAACVARTMTQMVREFGGHA